MVMFHYHTLKKTKRFHYHKNAYGKSGHLVKKDFFLKKERFYSTLVKIIVHRNRVDF
jgi:hypothetical protein